MTDAPASLTEQEARDRARLIEVDRYDITIDLRELLDGDRWLATSSVTFGCRTPGAVDLRRHPGRGGLGPAQRCRPRPVGPRRRAAGTALAGRRQHAGRLVGAGRHRVGRRDPAHGRPAGQAGLRLVVLRAGRRPTGVGLLRPARPQGGARLPGQRPGRVDGAQQLRTRGGPRPRRRRQVVDLRGHASAVDVRRRGQRRAVPRAAGAARRPQPGALLPPVAAALPGAGRRGAVPAHRARAGVLRRTVRDALPAGALRPGVRAGHGRRDGELGLRHLHRRGAAPAAAHLLRARLAGARGAARDGAHVVRRPRHDALVGRPVAQRGVRVVRLDVGLRRRDGVHRRVGHLSRGRAASRLPGGHEPGQPPDPHDGAGRRPRVRQLRRHHLLQGPGGARAADGLRLGGGVRDRAAELLPRPRLGQRRAGRPDGRDRRGGRPGPHGLGRKLAGPRGHRHAQPGRQRCWSPRARTAASHVHTP